jgi:LytS/YehU family sensor histidine kinase
MAGLLKRLLPPTAPPLRGIPKAILKAGVFGIIIGPVLGIFFGWSGPVHAAMISAVYCIVFYTLCALPSGYARQYFGGEFSTKRKTAGALTTLVGIAAASLLMLVLFERFPFQLQDVQIPVVLIMFALAWGYFVSTRDFADAEKQLTNARAHTRVLRSRMNPHFFFNTLNTISALIPEDPPAAQRMLGLMADMSRYVFAEREGEIAPLIHELEFARAYLEIEKVRFGSRLRCELPGDSDAEGLSIPIFTLQPLIENAVRHGISKRVGGGSIVVQLKRHGRNFSLAVENDVEESVSETHFFQRGHALDNIRERLQLIYGGQASIEVTTPQPYVVSVRIEAPVGQAQNGREP